VDDIINVAGHRLSTGAMEEVSPAIPTWPSVPSWACADEIKGEVPVGFVVTKAGSSGARPTSPAIWSSRVRAADLGPWPPFKTALVVKRLRRPARGRSCAER